MPSPLSDIPNVDVLLALEPEELAPSVLRAAKATMQSGLCHIQNISYQSQHRGSEVELAIREAWSWLVANVLLVPASGTNGSNGFMVLSRRGAKLVDDPEEFVRFKEAAAFPKALLHPSIADKVWLDLARGELDDAVFAAFKAVEVAVRDAAKLAPTDIGVALVRKAFDKTTGRLTDPNQPEAERDALAHLFAGAIGSYKNPHSHRTVTITDPREAQEMVMLASHLLRIVDARPH